MEDMLPYQVVAVAIRLFALASAYAVPALIRERQIIQMEKTSNPACFTML
jgi:hypothetical protein